MAPGTGGVPEGRRWGAKFASRPKHFLSGWPGSLSVSVRLSCVLLLLLVVGQHCSHFFPFRLIESLPSSARASFRHTHSLGRAFCNNFPLFSKRTRPPLEASGVRLEVGLF